jgi:hypothetical protein
MIAQRLIFRIIEYTKYQIRGTIGKQKLCIPV